MNANNLKQNTLDFMESLEGMTSIHHVAGFFRFSQRASSHFASLRDQGFPLPENAERFIEPPLRIYEPEQSALEPEPTPPQDPIDGNYYATQVVEHLRHFLPHASKGYKDFGKHYAVSTPTQMADRGEAIKGLLYAVIELAAEEGIIVTVERRPFPDGKLAMGHAMTCIETRWERKIYQHFMNLAATQDGVEKAKLMLKPTDELNRELAQYEWDQRDQWQKENGGPKRATYMEIGWIVNGRTIKNEDELTEYLRRVAIEVGISLFKPVPVPAQEAEWVWPAAEQEPAPELLQDQYTDDDYCEHCGQVIAADEDEGSQIPSAEVLAEMPTLTSLVDLSSIYDKPVPLEVLNTFVSLSERGTPLATKLAEQAAVHLGPAVLGHPYAPYPKTSNMCQNTPNMAVNPHVGSTFDSFLAEEGILDEATAAARKTVEAGDKWTIGITVKPDGSVDYYPV